MEYTKYLCLFRKSKTEGYKICLDLFNIRRFSVKNGSHAQEGWKAIIDTLLPYTDEIHLGVGRSDFEGAFDSMAELIDLYTGDNKTNIVTILKYIATLEKTSETKIPVVTEIPADSIMKVLGKKGIIATPSKLIEAHAKIVKSIKNIVNS